MKALERQFESGQISAIDLQLARFVERRFPGREALSIAAAVASHAVSSGHVCAPLSRLPTWLTELGTVNHELWQSEIREALALPELEDFPLVLDPAGRLYLRRLFDEEQDLARLIGSRAGHLASEVPADFADSLHDAFSFEPSEDQLRAVATAALRQLCIVSGGPGTGKTSVVSALLNVLHQAFGIAFEAMVAAAPTGKAVTRIKQQLGETPVRCMTLHRLLGLRRGGRPGWLAREDRLPFRVVLVDEVSMVNQSLLLRLLRRVDEHARVVLLGDRYQLASVEAGAVLASLCDAAGQGVSQAWAGQLAPAIGQSPPTAADPPRLCDVKVELSRNFRFASDAPIGHAAKAIQRGDVESFQKVLEAGDQTFRWQPMPKGSALRDALEQRWRAHMGGSGDSVSAQVAKQEQFRVLCAHRAGAGGVTWVNEIFEYNRPAWYHGRPLLISRNDPGLDLYNGDLGVCVAHEADRQTRIRVHFANNDLALPPSQVPEHESAYALTVHKAQGSEFERVLLILPPEPSPVTTRELLYTAITRARSEVEIWAPMSVLMHAVAHPTQRESGLLDRLSHSPG